MGVNTIEDYDGQPLSGRGAELGLQGARGKLNIPVLTLPFSFVFFDSFSITVRP